MIRRNDRDAGVAGFEDDHVGVLAQEREVVAEGSFTHRGRLLPGALLHGRATAGGERQNGREREVAPHVADSSSTAPSQVKGGGHENVDPHRDARRADLCRPCLDEPRAANHRSNDFSPVTYWGLEEPHAAVPPLRVGRRAKRRLDTGGPTLAKN